MIPPERARCGIVTLGVVANYFESGSWAPDSPPLRAQKGARWRDVSIGRSPYGPATLNSARLEVLRRIETASWPRKRPDSRGSRTFCPRQLTTRHGLLRFVAARCGVRCPERALCSLTTRLMDREFRDSEGDRSALYRVGRLFFRPPQFGLSLFFGALLRLWRFEFRKHGLPTSVLSAIGRI